MRIEIFVVFLMIYTARGQVSGTECVGQPNGKTFHVPNNCTVFISCFSEVSYVLSCRPGEIFLEGFTQCVPGYTDICELFTTTPVTTTQTTTTTTTTTTEYPGEPPLGPPELCIGVNYTFVADPSTCYGFFYCVDGLALPGECGSNQIFSELWRGCIPGDRATCTAGNSIIIHNEDMDYYESA